MRPPNPFRAGRQHLSRLIPGFGLIKPAIVLILVLAGGTIGIQRLEVRLPAGLETRMTRMILPFTDVDELPIPTPCGAAVRNTVAYGYGLIPGSAIHRSSWTLDAWVNFGPPLDSRGRL